MLEIMFILRAVAAALISSLTAESHFVPLSISSVTRPRLHLLPQVREGVTLLSGLKVRLNVSLNNLKDSVLRFTCSHVVRSKEHFPSVINFHIVHVLMNE